MAKSTGLITNSLSVRAWRGGQWASNPLSKSNLKSGLLGCCWAGSSPKPPASDVPISCHRVILKVRLKSSKVNPSLPKSERQTLGAGADGPQLATYPQSPFSGPVRCCDVTDLYQAFSQRTGPGRLWISLGANLLLVLSGQGQNCHAQTQPRDRYLRTYTSQQP